MARRLPGTTLVQETQDAGAEGLHLPALALLWSGTRLPSEAGFSAVRLYGSLAGTPYDHTAQLLVAVAPNRDPIPPSWPHQALPGTWAVGAEES
jgi:hypothetical protein